MGTTREFLNEGTAGETEAELTELRSLRPGRLRTEAPIEEAEIKTAGVREPASRGKGPADAIESWEEIERRVQQAKNVQLYLDFDGTLVAYQPRPDQVRLEPGMEELLGAIADHPGVTVTIVSGRRRAVLMRHIQNPAVKFMGLYGWEDSDAKHLPARRERELGILRKKLSELPSQAPGVVIEDKGLSVAVHFRDATPAVARRARAFVDKAAAGFRRDLQTLETHKAWDIVPREVRGKGAAVRQALRRAKKSSLAIYIGDDTTDEPAFEATRGGIAIRVGEFERTHARYRLRDPEEVRDFLARLEAKLR